jgi:SHS2 domain-containing protein
VDEGRSVELEVSGHDLPSLLFALLDEFLYTFSTDSFVCKRATITRLDRQAFKIRVRAEGEAFDLEK